MPQHPVQLLQELADSFTVTQLPTVVLVKGGSEVHRLTSKLLAALAACCTFYCMLCCTPHGPAVCSCVHVQSMSVLVPNPIAREPHPWCLVCKAAVAACCAAPDFTHKRPTRAVSQAIGQYLLQ
jgi:hypothetical protein